MNSRFRPTSKVASRRHYSDVEGLIIHLSGSLRKPGTRAERRAAEKAARKAR